MVLLKSCWNPANVKGAGLSLQQWISTELTIWVKLFKQKLEFDVDMLWGFVPPVLQRGILYVNLRKTFKYYIHHRLCHFSVPQIYVSRPVGMLHPLLRGQLQMCELEEKMEMNDREEWGRTRKEWFNSDLGCHPLGHRSCLELVFYMFCSIRANILEVWGS